MLWEGAMATGRKRKAIITARRQRRASQHKPGGKSKYARKAAYCRRHGVWGFDVGFPKPW